jgi:hypothetical protein
LFINTPRQLLFQRLKRENEGWRGLKEKGAAEQTAAPSL